MPSLSHATQSPLHSVQSNDRLAAWSIGHIPYWKL